MSGTSNNGMETLQATIRQIKTELRLAMNGVASTRMRESGLAYKVNFGVELPRLQEIAQQIPQDYHLAQALWNEPIRESKILATMLMPTADFSPVLADIWLDEIPNIEIARLTVMHLFARLPYATDKAFRWMADEKEMRQICGFLLMARLLMQGTQFTERALDEFRDQAQAAIPIGGFVAQAARSALDKLQD